VDTVVTVTTQQANARAVRRDAILDAAEQLIRSKGYERMSIQDVQDALGISRGAIYHYFGSKAELLEAVVERIVDAVMAYVTPIAEDASLSAVARLQGVFAASGRWKAERRELMVGLLEAWHSDDNAIVREHVRQASSERLAVLFEGILRQGVVEGSIAVTSPQHAARVLVAILVVSGESAGRLFLERLDGGVSFAEVKDALAAYDEAVERILGLPPASFRVIDPPTLDFWFA
jgi:AcrR family transcriptional regulator